MDNSFLVWSYMTDMSVIKNPLAFAFVPLEVDIENKHCSTGLQFPWADDWPVTFDVQSKI